MFAGSLLNFDSENPENTFIKSTTFSDHVELGVTAYT